MGKGRLEAFTDGVIAIIITIMVLELQVPKGSDLAALTALMPTFFTYVLSFVNVGIFWNNHHHMLHAAGRVNGQVLWANLHVLFWISLIPFVIRWIDVTHFAALPVASYGVVLFGAAVGYAMLQAHIVAANGEGSLLQKAIGRDLKGRISPVLYALGAASSFVSPFVALAIYVGVALMWFVPDSRIESRVKE